MTLPLPSVRCDADNCPAEVEATWDDIPDLLRRALAKGWHLDPANVERDAPHYCPAHVALIAEAGWWVIDPVGRWRSRHPSEDRAMAAMGDRSEGWSVRYVNPAGSRVRFVGEEGVS